jgi:hypothetical protein
MIDARHLHLIVGIVPYRVFAVCNDWKGSDRVH